MEQNNCEKIIIQNFISVTGHTLDLEITLYADNSIKMTLIDQTKGVDSWDPAEITRNYRAKNYIKYDDDEFVLVQRNIPCETIIAHMQEFKIASFNNDYFFNNIYDCPILRINKQYIPKRTLFQKLKLIFNF